MYTAYVPGMLPSGGLKNITTTYYQNQNNPVKKRRSLVYGFDME